MIVAGTSPFLYIDLGKDKPGLRLQRLESGNRWADVVKKGKVVESPIDIDDLRSGIYRLKE